jgi:hypothetical protein
MNFMDIICTFQEEHITHEHIDEARRWGERKGRLQALNNLIDNQKELRRRE